MIQPPVSPGVEEGRFWIEAGPPLCEERELYVAVVQAGDLKARQYVLQGVDRSRLKESRDRTRSLEPVLIGKQLADVQLQ